MPNLDIPSRREYPVMDFFKSFSNPLIMAGSGGSQSSSSRNLLGGTSKFDDDVIRQAIEKYNMEQDFNNMMGSQYDFMPQEAIYGDFGSGAGAGWGASMGGSSMGPVTTNWLGQGMGGGASQGWAGGGMAQGGPVQGGQSYVVGEEGPETFVPNQSGTIIPNFATDINSFWNELFSPRPNMEFEQANQQPPLMPRDSNIGGITPVPQSPTPWTR